MARPRVVELMAFLKGQHGRILKAILKAHHGRILKATPVKTLMYWLALGGEYQLQKYRHCI